MRDPRYAILRSARGVEVMRLDSVQSNCEIYEPVRRFRWDAGTFDAFDKACDLCGRLNLASEREDWKAVSRMEQKKP